MVALADVMGHDVGDVGLDDLLQGLTVPRAIGHPAGELGVPDEGVAAEELAVLAGNVGHDVAVGVVEVAARGLERIPLLSVLGHELAPLGLVVDDAAVLLVAVDGLLTGFGTEVLETGGTGKVVQLAGDHGRGGESREDGLGVHFG